MISAIIPTRNRGVLLKRTLNNLASANHACNDLEVIVVDNASSDKTIEIASESKNKFRCFQLIKNNRPFLLDGRHAGFRAAKGEILAFLDDDSFVEKQWLEGVRDSFADPRVGISGGPSAPEYETNPPKWLEIFKNRGADGYVLGALSLIELGFKDKTYISHGLVFGCNFAVRKKLVKDAGGFHPDGVPFDKLFLRGDGETALALKIAEMGWKAVYNPKQKIRHFVSSDRLSLGYFVKRAFSEGVTASFHRRRGQSYCVNSSPELKLALKDDLEMDEAPFAFMVEAARSAGENYHRACIKRNPELMNYIKKEEFFSINDYPEIDRLERSKAFAESLDDAVDKARVAAIWKTVCKLGRTAFLFGAGRHTRWLLGILEEENLSFPKKIIDESPMTDKIMGVEVIRPKDISFKDSDVLCLSTKAYLELFRHRCEKLFGKSVNLIEFY